MTSDFYFWKKACGIKSSTHVLYSQTVQFKGHTLMINITHRSIYGHVEGKCDCLCHVSVEVTLFLMKLFMAHQLIVGTTGRTALWFPIMDPEPYNGSVVFLTCRKYF